MIPSFQSGPGVRGEPVRNSRETNELDADLKFLIKKKKKILIKYRVQELIGSQNPAL